MGFKDLFFPHFPLIPLPFLQIFQLPLPQSFLKEKLPVVVSAPAIKTGCCICRRCRFLLPAGMASGLLRTFFFPCPYHVQLPQPVSRSRYGHGMDEVWTRYGRGMDSVWMLHGKAGAASLVARGLGFRAMSFS